ncbi:spore gernimation protein GerD [Peribacillus cavernae]|uniref:Spore gernimation protein GerD n=1 Tax=Peribacillus cavernae TaxID=1674310 RepID=A0A3S0VHX0_9BACI|nr:spore germination lipoprotein GerD [Peribacillus cavernae]MDQ0220611.1 spore germination protein D [Peribacillus cavernae]RUQ24155.1 spore gernimation protein GerD [Peribacillus cavernae]
MKSRVVFILFSLMCLVIITGCAQNEMGGENTDYEETKKMVVDILKTDDGKKALQDVMSDDSMKTQLIMEQQVVSDTIEKTITSDKGKEFWEKAFGDPKFAAAYAKSMKDEHEKLLKELTNDPQYRAMIIDIMKEPSLQKEFNDLLKSKEMREMSKKTLIETMDSPLVKAKLADILTKAAEEMPTDSKSGAQGEGQQGEAPGAAEGGGGQGSGQ